MIKILSRSSRVELAALVKVKMDPCIRSEIQKALEKLNTWCDEAELLLLNETRSILNNGQSLKPFLVSSTKTTSLLLTIIKSGKLARYSWVRTDPFSILDAIDQTDLRQILSYGERATFHLNKPHPLPFKNSNTLSDSQFRVEKVVTEKIENYCQAIEKEWPHWHPDILCALNTEECLLNNTNGLCGSYSQTAEKWAMALYHKKDFRFLEGLEMYSSEPVKNIISTFENKIRNSPKILSRKIIRGGKSSVLLSPRVVELLCKIITQSARLGSSWDSKLSKALPEDFELIDDPSQKVGLNATPFDHEGTITSRKVICHGPDLKAHLSDLKRSAAQGKPSSGNGFRRGSFSEPPADVLPSPQPTSLYLSPGKTTIEDILRDTHELFHIDRVLVPADRVHALGNYASTVFFTGYVICSGEKVAQAFAQNYRGRPLISSHPNSWGSLLDPKSIILSEGNFEKNGWFPYIFVPQVTWSD